MRAVAWTAEDLLADVRRTAFLPDASDQSDADVLAFADAEIRTLVGATVAANRGEHWFREAEQEIVPGTLLYRLPPRMLGRKVRAVWVRDPSGTKYLLDEVPPSELSIRYVATDTNNPRWFAFRADHVDLGSVPASAGWTLVISYLVRPSRLVPTTTTTMSRIGAATTTTQLSLLDDPTDAGLTSKYAVVDILRGVEPYDPLYVNASKSGANYTPASLVYDLLATTPVVIDDFTFDGFPNWSAATAAAGRMGAWLVQAEQTPFPQVPHDLWDALVRGTAAGALEAVRDPGAGAMRAKAMSALEAGANLMAPRDQRNTRRIISRGPLRVGMVVRRWR